MAFASFSSWLSQITRPNHPFYHPFQISLFASLSYVGTVCLTSIPPRRGTTLAILAYAISQLISPLFCQIFESYREISLIPFVGQVLQLTTTVVLAKVICQLGQQSLSFHEIKQVSLVFLASLYVAKFVLFKLRQHLVESHSH